MTFKIWHVWAMLVAIGIIYSVWSETTDPAQLYAYIVGLPVLGVVVYLLGYWVTRDDPDNYKSGWTF